MGAVKLIIYGHKENPSTPEATSGIKFEAQINPSSISHQRGILYNKNNTANSTSTDVLQYQGMEQDKLKFAITLMGENTATTGTETVDSVNEQLKKLEEVVCTYDGSIHRTLYNTVILGDEFALKCQLTSINVEYNLWSSQGKALRAEVDLEFVGCEDFNSAARNANNQSPDMTHVKTVVDGDHLPLMCQSVYDNMNHYIQIAELNNLTNFRQLRMGDPIVFPPINE